MMNHFAQCIVHQGGAESIEQRQLRFLDYNVYRAYHINLILFIDLKGLLCFEAEHFFPQVLSDNHQHQPS